MRLHDKKFPREEVEVVATKSLDERLADGALTAVDLADSSDEEKTDIEGVKTDIEGVKTDIGVGLTKHSSKALFVDNPHYQKASLSHTATMSNNNTAIYDLASDVAKEFDIDEEQMADFTGKFLDEQKKVPKKKKGPAWRGCCARIWGKLHDGTERCSSSSKPGTDFCGTHLKGFLKSGATPCLRDDDGKKSGLFTGRYDEFQEGTFVALAIPPYKDSDGNIQIKWEGAKMENIVKADVQNGAVRAWGRARKVPGKKKAGKVPAKDEESAQKLAEAFGVELPDPAQEFSDEVKDAIAEDNEGKMDFPPKKLYIKMTKEQKKAAKKKKKKPSLKEMMAKKKKEKEISLKSFLEEEAKDVAAVEF